MIKYVNMAYLIKCLIVFLCMLALSPSLSGATSSIRNIFILGGQSNMAGRGGVFKNITTNKNHWNGFIPHASRSHKSILRFTANLEWKKAHEPLHWDIDYNKTNGVGPGMAFANEILAKAGEKAGVIGLVPCAIGGTHITEWIKGTDNYTRLVDRIKASQKSGGKIRAFFWFQGESDAVVKEDTKFYKRNLTKFFTDLREDLNRPQLPIILVKIATHDTYISPVINYKEDVRKAQEQVSRELPKVRSIDAIKVIGPHNKGLNKDLCHLNIKSAVKVGKMLAYSYLSHFGRELHC